MTLKFKCVQMNHRQMKISKLRSTSNDFTTLQWVNEKLWCVCILVLICEAIKGSAADSCMGLESANEIYKVGGREWLESLMSVFPVQP